MPQTHADAASKTTPQSWRVRYLRAFGRDEDGSIIILTIVLLITMLVLGGMAVDFMRYEARRATLQSVADRAVLAAANLNQTLDSSAVVEDYFEKAGFADALVGAPVVVDRGNSRTVSVVSELDLNTFYLRLVGIDSLTAPARSSATEGVGKVEISLVLDISGSMRDNSRIVNMRAAAAEFAAQVLHADNGGQVSLNIIPYAGSTNPGPAMFDYLSGQRYVGFLPGPDGILGTADDLPYPNDSSCIEFTDADWATSGLPGNGRDQVHRFMVYPPDAANLVKWGWCPQNDTAIAYALSDPTDAITYINTINMHDGTGTHYAMKWGLALLDPTTQPAFEWLSDVHGLVSPEFANRPAPWADSETKKILVLMTDGRITGQWRPQSPFALRNTHTAIGEADNGTHSRRISTNTDNINRFNALCAMAKAPSRNIQVYTVGFEISGWPDIVTQMRNCASDPTMYFPASGTGLITVFAGIAERITDLRLNL